MSSNGKKICQGFNLDALVHGDIFTDILPLLEGGAYRIRPSDGKIVPTVYSRIATVPWIYVKSKETTNCGFWQKLIFKTYGLFPIGCLKCWKVVVRPRTVTELFQLHEYQDEEYKHWRNESGHCKCGIEIRKYVHGNYGGYFYNNTLQEGLECYDKVKTDIAKHISPDIPVILKRACTEFELKYKDSDNWEIHD